MFLLIRADSGGADRISLSNILGTVMRTAGQ